MFVRMRDYFLFSDAKGFLVYWYGAIGEVSCSTPFIRPALFP